MSGHTPKGQQRAHPSPENPVGSIDCKADDVDARLQQICADAGAPPMPTHPPAAERPPRCLVVLHAHMLAAAHRRNIASRACQEVPRGGGVNNVRTREHSIGGNHSETAAQLPIFAAGQLQGGRTVLRD